MVSNRLSKVAKHITKKKGKTPNLHENSRDTQRLQRAAGRDDKINRLAKVREAQNRTYLLRIKSFQSFTTEHEKPLTIPELQAMIEDYLGRDDEELAKLKAERRPGRPPMTRQTMIEQSQAVEQAEYAAGFWVPDLEDAAVLRKLKEWNGQWANLATLKFARLSKDGFKKESSFPPKGMS
ncbi:hypothetical protein IAQ61_010101 [Plenodomus lingam]|uniref:Translation machinery-associated protein 16 n=1 Tax=Leptosphaeria maculans (strain JN3 / isolate v23.1.3 / race Av1-4-5-6-7-8) TaxID=985895 RepID=E5A2Y3_LEPMJ|nr:hypothetical protein LEMA_P094050.1 [Plenodomus lingam JN3]KAH9861900.1 hypothetical protein IAQ61_010101 [Plenodomus lingam]CBX97996.1 hypothetical protein LEMA_P094050.1 [Plenodomus lingam JN3]